MCTRQAAVTEGSTGFIAADLDPQRIGNRGIVLRRRQLQGLPSRGHRGRKLPHLGLRRRQRRQDSGIVATGQPGGPLGQLDRLSAVAD